MLADTDEDTKIKAWVEYRVATARTKLRKREVKRYMKEA